ncbi:TonB-dependent siderophore receptor [Pseudoduganella danionis]|uniref:TonB-dependent siderophore receptor n=1 Tax=Pseudoduganella danionis TaxID=1890295 RepID=A0ABW9SPN1_9BURK|nr:TonB-dependent siderophore receptor [Pseudoduganella danionis]MTW33590.1 TonB-dependent siderophore receptor [Pseudoduganella danionis]
MSPATPYAKTRLHLALAAAGLCALHAPVMATEDGSEGALSKVFVKATVEKKKLGDSVSGGALGRKSELDTPFSTKAVSSDEIEDRLATSISEVLKYDASVTAISPPISTHPATIQMRGLRLDDLNGYKINGLAAVNRGTEMPLEMFESVEVLKGLSGFMYGFGSPGGIVNYVSKRPTTDKSFSAALGYQEGGALKEHFDIGGRVGEEGGFGYRLNLLHEDGGVQEESGTIHRNAAGLNLEWRVSDDVALTYESLYQRRKSVGGTDVVLSTAYAVPRPIAGNSKLNSIGAGSDVEFVMYTMGMDARVAPDWMMNLSYRTSDSTRVYKKDQYYITSDKADYKDRVTSELHGYHFDQIQASWEGKLQKWGVAHDIVTGFTSQNLTSTSSAVTPKTYLGTGNLYAPTIINVNSINWSGGTYQDEATRQEAVFFSDTVKFNDNWSVLAGARYNRFNENAYNTKNVVTASYPANRTTPTVALMFKPAADTTLYASYVEAMEMASNAPASAVNANQTFAPIKSKQAEAGIKTERSFWNASAALFQIKRGAQYTNAANVFVADGETKYQGLEVNSVVQASKNLSVEGGIMLLDATLENAAPGYSGKRAVGAPRRQASIQATWREVLPGLALHAGSQYLGELPLDAANVHTLSGTTLFDAGFNYRQRYFGKMVSVRANISNIANRKYWTYYQENYLNVGSPRTVSVNLRVDF